MRRVAEAEVVTAVLVVDLRLPVTPRILDPVALEVALQAITQEVMVITTEEVQV